MRRKPMGYTTQKKEIVAMLLAGGQGSRLGPLTKRIAKPAVPFGGRYRIIDFTLSNCSNSDIDVVGVLTQYQPLELSSHIGVGEPWELDKKDRKVAILPPYVGLASGGWYKGTANAVYHNMEFVDQYDPDYVLVISGDHIYKMDYRAMLDFHKGSGAHATVAVTEVDWKEAHRFGIMNTDEHQSIVEFEEKPEHPTNNLASMGVYIFNWGLLKEHLTADNQDPQSQNDFGKNIIPNLLKDKKRLMAYRFQGYWKDVGTIDSLWEANMDLLDDSPELDLHDPDWRIYSVTPPHPPQYVGPNGRVERSLVGQGCQVLGSIQHSIVFQGVHIGEGALIKDSVIMQNARISDNARVERCIVGANATIEPGCQIGDANGLKVTLVDENTTISAPEPGRRIS